MLKKMAKRPQIGGNIPFSPVCIYIQYSEILRLKKSNNLGKSTKNCRLKKHKAYKKQRLRRKSELRHSP